MGMDQQVAQLHDRYMMMIIMTMSKDVLHEIRNINLMNAVKFRSFTIEGTLSGNDCCHLKCSYCPQAGVAPVTHIQVCFT